MATRKPDADYAGKVIAAWIEARYGSPYGLAKVVDTARPATVYKIIAGQYDPAHKNVRRLEVALGWPMGTVARLGVKDFPGMVEIGAPAELVRVAKEIAPPTRKAVGSNRNVG
jgi:hypothetical protein